MREVQRRTIRRACAFFLYQQSLFSFFHETLRIFSFNLFLFNERLSARRFSNPFSYAFSGAERLGKARRRYHDTAFIFFLDGRVLFL